MYTFKMMIIAWDTYINGWIYSKCLYIWPSMNAYRPYVSRSIDAASVEHLSIQVYCGGQKATGRRRYATTVTIFEKKIL